MNSVVLIGRLARDPELGYTPTQTAVCKFTLAVDKERKKTEGDTADFITCKCFQSTAENLNRYKKKGDQIAVRGRISTGSYDGRDGKKVYYTEVLADHIEWLGSRSERPETPRNPETTFSTVDDYVPF